MFLAKDSCTHNWKKQKNIIFAVSFFYIIIYIPIALIAYFPQWYTINCKLHPRCEIIGYSNALEYIDELTGYFRHEEELISGWSAKEKLHLAEVRNILDMMTFAAFFSLLILIATFNLSKLRSYAKVNIVIILSFLIILPFFRFFWRSIFHPLLFANNLWKNNYFDRSFYIMPGVFFKHSLILIISASFLSNLIIWIFLRKRRKGE